MQSAGNSHYPMQLFEVSDSYLCAEYSTCVMATFPTSVQNLCCKPNAGHETSASQLHLGKNSVKIHRLDAGYSFWNTLLIVKVMIGIGTICYSMVTIFLGMLLDLGKGPLSIAMAMGISIVMLVALATSLSTSFVCCLV
jgi:hypothetical protein